VFADGTPSDLARFVERLVETRPTLLSVWGPPGYRKRAFTQGLAQHVGTLIACDLDRRRNRDPARAVLDAVVGGSRGRAERSSADRLAIRSGRTLGTARQALRREWPRTEGADLLFVRDAGGVLATPAGADLLAELIATRPAERTIALVTRAKLPPALAAVLDERGVCVGPDELALSRSAVNDLAAAAAIPADTAAALYDLTAGWPLVSRLLLFSIRRDGSREALDEAAALPAAAILPYAVRRVVSSLDDTTRRTVIASSIRPGATPDELARVVGERCDDAVLMRFGRLPFVATEDDRAFVHSEVVALLRTRYAALFDTLYERTIQVLVDDGAHGPAAGVALENRDAPRAAALLDAAPPYTHGGVGLVEYERVLDRVDHDVVARYPNIWLATIPFRRFAVDRDTYVREAETVYYCLPYAAAAEKRVSALMHLASAYFSLGRVDECDSLVDAALEGFAAATPSARATLLNFRAALRGEQGRFTEARALANEAAALANQPFAENMALHHVEASEALMRGRYDRVRIIFDELLRRQAHEHLPLYYAYSATDGAFWAWTFGDDATWTRLLGALEEALTPGLELGFARMIDAARGNPIDGDDAYAWPVHVAVAEFYRLGNAADADEALDAARRAASHADQRGDPMLQVLAHAALYVLDATSRAAQSAILNELAAGIESPELREAVCRLIAGEEAGILEPFVRRRVIAERQPMPRRAAVELLGGRIFGDGRLRRVSGKELELVALLASSYGPVSRDRIGEVLWEHLDPEEWPNNLKVTVHRLRDKLGDRDAIEIVDGQYRISQGVDVDLRRYEAAVREIPAPPLDAKRRDGLTAIVDAYRTGATGSYERLAGMQTALARIHDVVCAAASALAADALDGKRYDAALEFAHTVNAVDPLSEAGCELVMKVNGARGDADAARREFRRYASELKSALEAEPSARLVELARAASELRSADPADGT